jgi:hypothetical protein
MPAHGTAVQGREKNLFADSPGHGDTAQLHFLKLPLTIIFYIYACHKKDLHLLSHFVRLTLYLDVNSNRNCVRRT